MIDRIADGRTDLVFDYLGEGHLATSKDSNGTSLIEWCAYYGDVSAIKFLLANGESLQALRDNLGLNAAAFHGHWRLCQFLIENGADVNLPLPDTGEMPLHAALSSARPRRISLLEFYSRREPIRTARPNRPSKPAPSCAIAVPGPRLPCIAPLPSAMKTPFSFFSMLGRESTRRT